MKKFNNDSGEASVSMWSIFIPLLTTLFIGLKLTGYISWSWWWVLSPILAPVGLLLAVMLALVCIGIVSN